MSSMKYRNYEEKKVNNIIIRKAEKADLPSLKRLIIELVESMDNNRGIGKHIILENCHGLLTDPNTQIIISEKDGTVIGLIHFTFHKTLSHIGHSCMIEEIVVTNKYRNKGIGKRLIHAVFEKCKNLGCCEIEVSTELSNTSAREFYKSIGFEERGIILEKEL